MNIKKMMLVGFVLIAHQLVISMEETKREPIIVKGDVYLVPNPLRQKKNFFYGDMLKWNLCTEHGKDVVLADKEWLVQVWAGNKQDAPFKTENDMCEKYTWGFGDHPIVKFFPFHLPYALLKDKHEGDIFSLYTSQPDGLVKVQLTCNQLRARNNNGQTFDEYLRMLVKDSGHIAINS